MSRLTVRLRILAIFTKATSTANKLPPISKRDQARWSPFTTGGWHDRCCAADAKQINKQGVSRCQAGFIACDETDQNITGVRDR